MFIVCVTACPTGIAHTFMAAESLQNAARDLGLEIKVETQGSLDLRDDQLVGQPATETVDRAACFHFLFGGCELGLQGPAGQLGFDAAGFR